MTPRSDALRAAEDELQRLRGALALVAAWINNPAHDHKARRSLAKNIGLPAPRRTKTQKRTRNGN